MKAVIFDLNGIWIKSPPLSKRFHEAFGVSTEEFLLALKDVMAKVRMPKAGDAYSYWKPYLQKWGVELPEDDFYRFWFDAEKEVPEVTELARDLKKRGVRVFVLSNNFSERAAYYEKNFPFLEQVADKVYYSWQTGFVKPDRRAYQLILEENKLDPSECVYFDDSKENVEVATGLGIHAYPFEDVARMKENLKKPRLERVERPARLD